MANKRRFKGNGSIVDHKGKKLCRYWATLSDGTKKRVAFYANDQKSAEKELRKRLKEQDDGKKVYTEKCTIEEYYISVWKPVKHPHLKETTIETYERTFRLHVVPLIGDEKLATFGVASVEKYIERLSRQTSAKQCANVKKVLSPMFDYAVGRGIMPDNPFKRMDKNVMPKYEVEEREIWEQDELQDFLKAAEDSKYYPIYKLVAIYGLRRGEALGLRVKDVELKNGEKDSRGNEDWGMIKIRQQVVAVKNHSVITSLKTKASKRELPLTKDMYELLQPYVQLQTNRNGLLFHTSTGSPIAPRNLERDYYKFLKKAEVEHIPFHSFRHTACTDLLEKGAPVKAVQTLLGHKDLNTTLKIYAHCSMDDKRAAMYML